MSSVEPPISPVTQGEKIEIKNVGGETPQNKIDHKKVKTNKAAIISNLSILHVEEIPVETDYETIANVFGLFGTIKEIRMNFQAVKQKWDAWVTFADQESALKSSMKIGGVSLCGSSVKGALTDKVPRGLDIYRPADWVPSPQLKDAHDIQRTPKPPMWLVATSKGESHNYYKFSKYLQKKVGGISSGDISRFGKNTVLIHAKSLNQSYMLTLMNVENSEMIKDIRPHLNFSYGRGVIFDRDLYEFPEEEILEMSPRSVWRVKKIPGTSMIILTFEDPNVPSHVSFENERVRVRPFIPKPLQCFNCFRFGHPSHVCKNTKLCQVCSAPEHGPCSAAPKCANCQKGHKSRDKNCEELKYEEAALNKANAEHINVGYAKKLLGRAKSYARALVPIHSTEPRVPVKASVPVSARAPVQGTRTHPSEGAVMPAVVVVSPLEGAVDALPSPSPIIQVVSQAESLPDLEDSLHTKRKVPKSPKRSRKRERTASFSPPLSNRYDLLAPSDPDEADTVAPVAQKFGGSATKIVEAEVHHPLGLKKKIQRKLIRRKKHLYQELNLI